MSRDVTYFLLVVAVLASAGAVVMMPARGSSTTAALAGDLHAPDVVGWTGDAGVPAEVLPLDAAARAHRLGTYRRAGSTLWLAVGHYPDERDGQRPAAHDLLFPAHGWSDLTERREHIALGDGRSLAANVLVMRTPERRLVIMYWYQIGELGIASDHWYRTRLLGKRLVGARADSALVRLASEVPGGSDPAAVIEMEKQFVASLYPTLLHQLSR